MPDWLHERPFFLVAAALIAFAIIGGFTINKTAENTAEKSAEETTARINEQARASAWHEYDADLLTCRKNNKGRRDAAGRDRDIKVFAETASAARIKDGDLDIAAVYNLIADRARVRQVRALARIENCHATVPRPPFERPKTAPGSETLLREGT